MTKPKHIPKTAKGTRRTVEVCCAAWIDLLGFRGLFEEAGFNPLHPSAEKGMERLSAFNKDVIASSGRYFPTHAMNDGVVAFRDLSPRTRSVTYDFLRRTLHLHERINTRDVKDGFPGVRTILAAGYRKRMANQDFDWGGKDRSIRDRLADGTISTATAIEEALRVRTYSRVIPELQANFAFSKAYLVDGSGTAAGFPGPAMYVDLALFEEEAPNWVSLSKPIDWTKPGITAAFSRVEALDNSEAGRMEHRGIHDAFGVASRLGATPEIVSAMKATRVGGNR